MFAFLLVRCGRQRFAFALGGHFLAADAGFQLQQLQLQIAQTLAARTVLGDALETQPLFQHLDLQLGKLQLVLEIRQLAADFRKQRFRQLLLQLFEKFDGKRIRGGRCR